MSVNRSGGSPSSSRQSNSAPRSGGSTASPSRTGGTSGTSRRTSSPGSANKTSNVSQQKQEQAARNKSMNKSFGTSPKPAYQQEAANKTNRHTDNGKCKVTNSCPDPYKGPNGGTIT